MHASRILKTGWLILISVGIPAARVDAQTAPNSKATPSLRELFQGLVEHYNPASLPKQEDVLSVIDHQVPSARAEIIGEALPAIFTALAHPDRTVKVDAADALFLISRRPDGSDQLRKYVPAIAGLLSESDWRLQYFALVVFQNLRPPPVREILPALLAFLKRTDRDPRYQAGAVAYLMSFAPDDPEAVGAVLDFLSGPLDSESRVAALNALGTMRVKDPHIINAVMGFLEDPDPQVRFAAFQALQRMGPAAFQQAKPALQKVADDYVELLQRNDVDVSTQVSAMYNLLQYAPDDPQVMRAIEEFFPRPMLPAARKGALNYLRIPHAKASRLINVVIGSLRDPDAEVRTTAVHVLIDMGSQALARAQPALEELTQGPNQPADVKDAAKKALEEIRLHAD